MIEHAISRLLALCRESFSSPVSGLIQAANALGSQSGLPIDIFLIHLCRIEVAVVEFKCRLRYDIEVGDITSRVDGMMPVMYIDFAGIIT